MQKLDKKTSIKPRIDNKENTSDMHPSISHLGEFVNREYSTRKVNDKSLKLHVAECLRCQNVLAVLTSLKFSHRTLDNTVVSESQHMLIVDYVNRGLSISRKKRLRQKIQDEPATLKAMLHYASHSEAMRLNASIQDNVSIEEEGTNNELSGDATKKKFKLSLGIDHLLRKFNLPFKWALPFNFSTVYSICVSVLFISLLIIVLSNKMNPVELNEIKPAVAPANNSQIKLEFISNESANSNYIRPLLPDDAIDAETLQNQKSRVAGKVKVSLSDKESLNISWPVYHEATSPDRVSHEKIPYTLNFYDLTKQTKKPALSVVTRRNFIELDITNFVAGKDYHWAFFYQTVDERKFQAEGGFVIRSLNTKN